VGSVFVSIGPIMQLEWRIGPPRPPQGQALTVLTLNTGRGVSSSELSRVVEQADVDIAVFQECGRTFSMQLADTPGWFVRSAGSLCSASRYPIISHDVLRRSVGGVGAMAIALVLQVAPTRRISLFNVHLETVREGIDAVSDMGPSTMAAFRDNLASRALESRIVSDAVARAPHPAIVAGDFNLPTDSAIYRENWRRLSNAFEQAGVGFGYTKYTSWWGARIDHILYDGDWRAVRAGVGPALGSDHRPVIATLEFLP
jgi:endonuclease/exonuclease/phosphatase family metal-dependent hydrolase